MPAWIHHGDSAHMVCEFDKDLAQLSWALTDVNNRSPSGKDGLILYAYHTSTWSGSALNRTTGTVSERETTLTIHEVDWRLDGGRYYCITIDSLAGGYFSSYASSIAMVSGKLRT